MNKESYEYYLNKIEKLKILLEQIKRASDKDSNTIYVCESAIDICNNLLREPPK